MTPLELARRVVAGELISDVTASEIIVTLAQALIDAHADMAILDEVACHASNAAEKAEREVERLSHGLDWIIETDIGDISMIKDIARDTLVLGVDFAPNLEEQEKQPSEPSRGEA